MKVPPIRRCARLFSASLLSVLLTGCASVSDDGGVAEVRALGAVKGFAHLINKQNGDTAAAINTKIDALLAAPLTVDAAITVALLNNSNLQAAYAELGIAEADLVQSSRIANPVFSFSSLKGHDGIEIERKLMLPVMGLLLKPVTGPLERRRYQQVQFRTAIAVLDIADATRRAYYGAVAAQQTAQLVQQIESAAAASAALAARMGAAGNWSPLQQAREEAFHADSVAQLARKRQVLVSEREQLTRLMGLLGSRAGFTLPAHLPDLPATAHDIGDSEAQAMANRLDILMATKELAGMEESLALVRTSRFINLLDLGYLNNTNNGERASGYEIELQIPLFDWGGARVARAEASYLQAMHRAASATVEARSQVREAHAAYRSAYALARHYHDSVIPLKKRISDQQLLRYNGMLISVFDLLADAREQITSVSAAIDAQRDYWLADAALQAAMSGAGKGQTARATVAVAADAGVAAH